MYVCNRLIGCGREYYYGLCFGVEVRDDGVLPRDCAKYVKDIIIYILSQLIRS